MGGEQGLDLSHEQAARQVQRAVAERWAGVGHDVMVGQHQGPPRPRRAMQGGHAAPHESGLEARFECRAHAHPSGRGMGARAAMGGLASDTIFASPRIMPSSVYR